jgi:hypothetical protein
MKRVLRVITTHEDIEDKRDIDGKRSHFQRVFELVSVIDGVVEISRFGKL